MPSILCRYDHVHFFQGDCTGKKYVRRTIEDVRSDQRSGKALKDLWIVVALSEGQSVLTQYICSEWRCNENTTTYGVEKLSDEESDAWFPLFSHDLEPDEDWTALEAYEQSQLIPALASEGLFRLGRETVFYEMCEWKLTKTEAKLGDDRLRLLLLDALDKDRSKWERLERKFDGQAGSPAHKREPIPEDVRIFVWRRDQGRCVKCGGNERLEFDHVIPFSKGGSNTARNLQLLCELCNREKGATL